MTVHNVFMRNKLFLSHYFDYKQFPKELDKPSKLILGQQIYVDDPFERYQMPSFGIPAPVTRTITNFISPSDPNWISSPVQTVLNCQSVLDDGVEKNDLYLDDGTTFKLSNFKNIEESPRGPHLEILMNFLERLASFHGISMPKFQLFKEENSLSQEDLNPVGGSSFDHVLTSSDLSTFRLANRIWYVKDYIFQIQDWLDKFAKELGFTKGSSMYSWCPKLGLTVSPIDDYMHQIHNKTFKENIFEPNDRPSFWTPRNRSDLGSKGKLYRNEHHRVFPLNSSVVPYPTAFYLEGAMHTSSPYTGPYAIISKVPEDVPPPRPQNTFGGFIKGTDGVYYWHISNPFDPVVSKFGIANIPMSPSTTSIYPTIGSGFTQQLGNIFNFQFYDFMYNAPYGTQTLNAGFYKYTTHRIFIFRTDGDLKKRYGITASNPKCLFSFRLDTNNGGYSRLADIPTTPGTRPLTAGAYCWGRQPYKKIKVTCGKLDNKFGYYTPPHPGFPFNGQPPPPPPWSWFNPEGGNPNKSHIYIPYLQSHADILNDVAGQIEGETNSLLAEINCSDMPFTDVLITYPANYPFFFTDPFIVQDRQKIEQVLDMSPLFTYSGDFVYVCVSYHDFFQEVNAFSTYDFLDAYNSRGVGPTNFDVYRNLGNGIASMGNGWNDSFIFPTEDLPSSYLPTQDNYVLWKTTTGDIPTPFDHYWKLGNAVDVVFKSQVGIAPMLPVHLDGKVYR